MSARYDEILADNCFGQIIVPDPNTTNAMLSSSADNSENSSQDNQSLSSISEKYGFSLEELFNMARRFLKEKQGSKAIQLKYAENVRLIALSKQATIGKWDPSYTENVGLLDVVGKDRKQAWIALGDMGKDEAKQEFIKTLLECSPSFEHHLEAHHVEQQEKERLRQADESRRKLEETERARQFELEQVSRLEEQRRKREDLQRKQIQDALNQQTYPQFKAYAEQQYKDNRQAQDELIRQLQEQHFQQYMQQVYQQQLLYQQQQREKTNMEQQSANTSSSNRQNPSIGLLPTQVSPPVNSTTQPMTNSNVLIAPNSSIQSQFESLNLNTPLQSKNNANTNNQQHLSVENNTNLNSLQESVDDDNDHYESGLENDDGTREYPSILQANMWMRKDIKEFKDTVRKEKDGVIKIGSGETVTVRVPTHEDGHCIFWEFATDYYDIGFGLYFEWSKVQSNTVTVHVSDSSEDDEEGEDGVNPEKKDIEKGEQSTNKPPKPYQDEIIPIFRRDSHEEIYAGSHNYPGHGVYLLKFDNSYSLWRSKTLYYRVYYSK